VWALCIPRTADACNVARVSCNVEGVSCNVARAFCNITGNTCNITRNTCNGATLHETMQHYTKHVQHYTRPRLRPPNTQSHRVREVNCNGRHRNLHAKSNQGHIPVLNTDFSFMTA